MGRLSCYLYGQVTVIPAAYDAGIGGTAAVTTATAPDCSIGGSVALDSSVATAFLNPTIGGLRSDRHCSATVSIDGESLDTIAGLVVVRRELDNPIQTAEFELSDPRVARYNSRTLSWGDSACVIAFLSGPPGGVKTWGSFTGKITAPANTGNNRSQGRFQATSDSADWANAQACIVGAAYEGKHRGQLMRMVVESAGGTVANPDIDNLGAIVNRPYEYMGPPTDFLRKCCEIEGMHFRTNPDGTVEFLYEAEVLAGPALYAFKESNYDNSEEEPASAPVTSWVFNGTVLATGGTDGTDGPLEAGQRTVVLPIVPAADGSYSRVEVTFDKTTELFRRQTDYAVQQADGVVTGPSVLQPVGKTEIESYYPRIDSSSGDYNYSGRLDRRVVRRWALGGTRASVSTGNLWQSGDYYVEVQAGLVQVEEIEEVYQYDPETCTQKVATVTRKELFAPRCDPAGVGAHVYVDGSASTSPNYTLRETMKSVRYWTDDRNPNVGALPTVTSVMTVTRWIPNAFAADAVNVIDSYIAAETVRIQWVGDASQTRWEKTTTTSEAPGVIKTWDKSLPPAGTTVEVGTGPVPGPPNGSADVPQFAQQAFVWPVDLSALYPFAKIEQTETLSLVETTAEADVVGHNRIAHAIGTIERIKSQTIPFLREGDHVTFQCNARGISTARDGYVLSIEHAHSVDPFKPSSRQLTRVFLPYTGD